jgi:Flp pilus assembly protein TadD
MDSRMMEINGAQYGSSSRALFWAGQQLLKEKKIDEAREKFIQAERAEETPSALLKVTLALAAIEKSDLASAEQYLRRALEIEPAHPQAGNLLGEILMRQDKFQEAIQMLVAQCSARPNDVAPQLMLGLIYADRTHDRQQALLHLNKVLALKPNDQERTIALGKIAELNLQ